MTDTHAQRKLRLSVIATHLPPASGYGGVVESTGQLLSAWKKQGHDIRWLCCDASANGPLSYREIESTIGTPGYLYKALIAKAWGFGPGALVQCWRAVSRADAVYISGIFTWPVTIAAIFCRIQGKPCIAASRGGLMGTYLEELRQTKRWKWLFYKYITRPSLRRAVAMHATTKTEAGGIQELLPDVPVVIVPNGINCDEIPGYPAIDPSVQGRTLIYVGRISQEKGILKFLRIWQKLAASDDRFVILGDGSTSYANEVKKLSSDDSRILFKGYIPRSEIFAEISKAHALVLPSGIETPSRENFGNVVAEALAVGRMCLTSSQTSWRELEEESIGMTFETGEADISRVLKNFLNLSGKDIADRSSRARAFCIEKYDISNCARTLTARF